MGRNNFTAFIYGKQSGRCVGSRKPRKQKVRNVEFCCPNCNSHYLYDITDVPNYCPECGIRFDT